MTDRRSPAATPLTDLLAAQPGLGRFMTGDQLAAAARFSLPRVTLEAHADVRALVEDAAAFGVLVLEGMLFESVRLDRQPTLVALGPGAFATVREPPRAMPLITSRVEVPARASVVLLGDAFLLAASRWPGS